MKKFVGGFAPILLSVVLLVSGCATQPSYQSKKGRFQEAAFTDAVIQFQDWDSILVLRPDIREAGFLRELDRNELQELLSAGEVKGRLAAIVVSEAYLFSSAFTSLAAEWQALLQDSGFQRVVFLRAGLGNDINGLAILHDSGARSGITSS